ncbi:MAG: tetratricopeptide repeat protein [Ignavibacteriales bacterium]
MRRLAAVTLVLILVIAGCAPGAKKPPAPPGAATGGTPEQAPGVNPEVAARIEEAKRAFLAEFKEESIYERASDPSGFQYREKEILRELPVESLLAGIRQGLPGAKPGLELAFWLDLFSIVPDQTAGASSVLLDYLTFLSPGSERYQAYQAAQTHLSRLMSDQDAGSVLPALGRHEVGLQYLLLSVLRGKGILTAEKAVELLKQPGVDPQAVIVHFDPITTGLLSLLGRDFDEFEVGTRVAVIDRVSEVARWGNDDVMKKNALSWLDEILKGSNEPAVRQEILYQVCQVTGSKESLGRLVADVDENGAAQGIQAWGNHSLLREIRSGYPDSYLARGFRAYEAVRGRRYFVLDYWDSWDDPWPFEYGAGQYDPAREIPGWLGFLKDFEKHPGADDAAYRLGRCYEIQGKWKEALMWLARAMTLPDGDLGYDSRGRLLFVLDARVPAAELERLAGDPGSLPGLGPVIQYTLAVRDIRGENYQRASERLAALIAKHGGEDADATGAFPLGGAIGLRYPFWRKVREQQGWVSRLAEATAQSKSSPADPEAMYRIGAEIYRNQFIYYNYLWADARQGFNWIGHINELWAETPEGQAYLQGLINYQHALKWFEASERAPQAAGELKAKALYSQGLAYIGILQWGQDSETVLGEEAVRAKVVDTFKRFVETYPRSSMADDALLTIFAYTRDKTQLERLLRDYPNGDRADQARKALAE